MAGNYQEQERLKRLRERQLSDRDPLVKQRQFQRATAQREKRLKKPYSLGKMWKDIPHIWKGFFYSLLAGLIAILVIPSFLLSPWAFPITLVVAVISIIFGIVIGRAIDTRENIKELIR
jgi:Flp pilus assembly protein TadB